MVDSISVVDLFCGAGGLTYGFEKAGLLVKAGYDIDPDCQFPYDHNTKSRFILENVEYVTGKNLEQHFLNSQVKVLAGCAPCQPFSTYARRYSDKQEKWKLLKDFARLIEECQPEIVSMENVLLVKHHPVFHSFLNQLNKLHYCVTVNEVNCLDYGIPQTRKRLVLLASKLGRIGLIEPQTNLETESYWNVRKTIGHLEPLNAGETSKMDRLHSCSNLSAVNLKRIQSSKPGGTWRDWPAELRAKCHTQESGKTYPSVYGRMEWDNPSPTITTQCFGFGNGRFGHPEQDRAISLREASLLQTFPDDYEFVAPDKPIVFERVGRLIGNAVPVKLGEVIGESIICHIEKHLGSA